METNKSQIVVITQTGKNTYLKEYTDGTKEKIVFPKDAEVHDFYEP